MTLFPKIIVYTSEKKVMLPTDDDEAATFSLNIPIEYHRVLGAA
jgi:hypothetical protein